MSNTETPNLFGRNESDPSPREIAEQTAKIRAERQQKPKLTQRELSMITIRMPKEDREVLNKRAAHATMTLQAYCYNLLFPPHKFRDIGMTDPWDFGKT